MVLLVSCAGSSSTDPYQVLSNTSKDESAENRIVFGDGNSYDRKVGRSFEMPVPEDNTLRLTEGSSGFYLTSIGSYDFIYDGKAGETFDITVWQTEQRGNGQLSIVTPSGSTLEWTQESITIDPETESPPAPGKLGDTYNVSIRTGNVELPEDGTYTITSSIKSRSDADTVHSLLKK